MANYVLQRVNNNVFKKPEIIAENIRLAGDYLAKNHPDYLFPTVVKTVSGDEMVFDKEGFPWRLFPFIPNTYTVDEVETPEQAFSAAREFGMLTRNLEGVDVTTFHPTIDRFHDLSLRWNQFESALKSASVERQKKAQEQIEAAQHFSWLVNKYSELISSGTLVLRVTHNDTKINNILFDSVSGKALCAIDLDTLMPGYFIYDLGDMIRTFVSPVNEGEKDVSKVIFREEIYDALVSGYMESMGSILSEKEKESIPFGGMMMTYIMALRMLTDFLNGDVYYHTTYPGQNLVRATNQFALLQVLDHQFS